MTHFFVKKQDIALQGELSVPGDKSCSQRALMIASQLVGEVKISGLLESGDVLSTANALKNLGVLIEKQGLDYVVSGCGLGSLMNPEAVLDLGNSGTGSRLLMGLLSTQKVKAIFTGDQSLSSRPMSRVMDPLKKYGANFIAREENFLPVTLIGNDEAVAIEHLVNVPSAQVKSALIFAALNAHGESQITEIELTRDHTEIMLKYLGFDLKEEFAEQKKTIKINAIEDLPAKDITISGDPSSAAFIAAAALLIPGSEITITNVLVNKLRIGFYEVLLKMGAQLEFKNQREVSGEQVADLYVKYSQLTGFNIPAELAPAMIDEYPILAVLSCFAKGKTRMNGLKELKVKESNRLAAIEENLLNCGVAVTSGADWLEIDPEATSKIAASEIIKTYDDHRIAMSFIVLGMVLEEGLEIDDTAMIATSFPEFFGCFAKLGLSLEQNQFYNVVTVDGTAGSGKGTIARAVANNLGYKYLDTGKLYRALAYLIITSEQQDNFTNQLTQLTEQISPEILSLDKLLNDDVGNFAAKIAALPEVRKALLSYQHGFIAKHHNVVLDGRDTGSVIYPQAEHKYYVDAALQVRAERRFVQNKSYYLEHNISAEQIATDLAARDEADKSRKVAPLIVPEGAEIIDNSGQEDLNDLIATIVTKINEE